ncbi:hypothetical protein EVAR_66142_1 [Eumeta japonica]|uniref:Uncharacterized protein n=1 Tax=Eumeta variegata TaxID=151549 RepID=A0A4C1YVW7_EUMVA|nr:hypothetical protein EVAR_66142_1 [Eumeta japonica]
MIGEPPSWRSSDPSSALRLSGYRVSLGCGNTVCLFHDIVASMYTHQELEKHPAVLAQTGSRLSSSGAVRRPQGQHRSREPRPLLPSTSGRKTYFSGMAKRWGAVLINHNPAELTIVLG